MVSPLQSPQTSIAPSDGATPFRPNRAQIRYLNNLAKGVKPQEALSQAIPQVPWRKTGLVIGAWKRIPGFTKHMELYLKAGECGTEMARAVLKTASLEASYEAVGLMRDPNATPSERLAAIKHIHNVATSDERNTSAGPSTPVTLSTIRRTRTLSDGSTEVTEGSRVSGTVIPESNDG